jgi:hypothetical protein
VASHRGPGARAGKRRPAGKHFEEHARQTVQIAAPVEVPLRASLFRAHVRGCSDHESAIGYVDIVSARGRNRGCHSKIRDYRLPLLDQDILGLDVAVEHVVPVRITERRGDRVCDSERGLYRQRTLDIQPVA